MHLIAGSRGLARPSIALAIALLLALLAAFPTGARAQAFATNGCTGCHSDPDTPYPAMLNAANAGNIVTYAISQGMTGNPAQTISAGDLAEITAYIQSFLPAVPNQNVAFNSGSPVTSTPLVLPDLDFQTDWGAINTATGASGSNGTVTFPAGAGATRSALFTPTACVASDQGTFTFRGTGPGGSTSTRTMTVNIGNPTSPPVITTGAPPNGQTGVSYSFDINVAACESIVAYTLTAGTLPPGLALNGSSGVISGTPTTTVGSPFTGTITATYPGGLTDTQPFSIAVTLGPPVVTSASPAPNGAVGVPYGGYTIVATQSPTSYGATGLPPGLAVDATTGAIGGTPTSAAGSPYSAQVSATNAGGTGVKTVVFNVVPAIGSLPTASGQSGVPFTYQITEAPGPAYTSHAALTALPPGLSLDAASGLISGTPTLAALGTTNVQLRGANAFGNSATFTLAITITLGPPVIDSALTANGGEAIAFSYQITATNPPHSSFNATGLPPGLSIDTTSGLISGTPASGSAGSYPVTISATNATATGSDTLTLLIAQFAPVITSAATASGQTGTAFSYQIAADNGPTGFAAAGLPPGLAVNPATGEISGIPTAVGSFAASMTASNGAGSDTKPLTIDITLGPPVITSGPTAGGAVGFPFSYQIAATNSPGSYGVTGALPPGVALDATSGLISGTPTANGSFNVTISATNTTATANAPLAITIAVGVPAVTSAALAGATGEPFSYQVQASNGATSYSATGLPPGLALNAASGAITGTPTAAGTFSVNVSATNATGTGSGVLTITVALSAPTVTSPETATARTGQSFLYTIRAANAPATFAATGLPPGLTLDAASGVIRGIPTTGGVYPVTITITNATGTTSFVLTITVGYTVPTAQGATVEVPFEQPTPIALPVTGEVFSVEIVALPDHGLVTTQPGSAVVVYTPASGYSGFDTFTYTVTNPAGTSAPATVNITVGTAVPLATAATLTVQLNTPGTFDMGPFVKGSGLTGVTVTTPPSHGSVAVNGMSITYTPRTDYFGTDSFAYLAFGNAGSSAPATVTVEIVGRPDPSADRDVVGLVEAQNQAARRFASTQVANFNRRMESLHRGPVPPQAPAPSAAAGVKTAAAPEAEPRGTASDAAPMALVASLMHAVASRSLALDAVGGNGAAADGRGLAFWIGGTANFGNRDADGGRSGMRFSTDGLSLGVDRRFGARLALGIGAGYARDETDIGTGGTRSEARGGSLAAYGSYQPTAHTFVDALLGYGELRFDSSRHVEPVDAFATMRRDGRQLFGSLAFGYEHRRENLVLSPYGRFEFSVDRLERAGEQGAGDYALTFEEQEQRSLQAAVGLRAESRHETRFGWAIPRARIEYRRELEGRRAAGIRYADLFDGPRYTVTPAGTSRNSLLLGIGSDFVFHGGLRLGIDYQAQRASGASNVQGVRLMLTQELDANGAPPWRWEPVMFRHPVTVDFGYAWDDNVNRSRESWGRLGDSVFSLSANQSRFFPIGANARLLVTGLVSGEKFERYAGLGRLSAGAQAEVQYRSSGAYDATTWSVVGRAMHEEYESQLRTGQRYFLGVAARRALTDRIEVYGEAGVHARRGRSQVFHWEEYAAKLNVDYSLGRQGTLYATGEYRRGDTVSSGLGSLANLGVAEVFVEDDAYPGLGFFAYRFDADTFFGTIGWNYPLGARDSIDLSWRRVQSEPRGKPAFDFTGSRRYIDNQYSIVYLMRF